MRKNELAIHVGSKDALIVVDFQKDFCPGGALAVKDGDKISPALNEYIRIFSVAGGVVFATRDWHPDNHVSFKAQGGIWPPHCVRGTEGAEFHPGLHLPKGTKVVSKATDQSKEAYSGFDGTDLDEDLQSRGVENVYVGGLATDYCVKNTVLDAIRAGFDTALLVDAIRGVDLNPGDSERAMGEMAGRGARKAGLEDFVKPKGPE